MPTPRLRALPLVCLLATLARAENPEDAGWTLRDDRTVHPLKAGTPVSITNLAGDVRVRQVPDPALTVVAMIQQHRDDPRIAAIRKGDTLPCQVEALFPGAPPEGLYPPGRAARVDLTVFVPPGSPVSITTAGGRIEAKGLAGDVTARSDTGKILVRTPGLIDVSSRRGDVDVQIRQLGRGRTFRIHSESGKASVRMPPAGAATVRATTTGRIASDFTMSVVRPATSSHKSAVIQFGTSALSRGLYGWALRRSRVELVSEHGDLSVLAHFPELEDP